MSALHPPVTVTDEYLAGIHGLLTEIRDRLPESKPAPERTDGTVYVAEPGKRTPAMKPTPRRRD